MDRAPVAVRDPDGEQNGPYRAYTEGGRFFLADVKGVVVLDVEGQVERESATQAWVQTTTGVWHVRDLCGCNENMRRWKREWREGSAFAET